MSYSISLKSGQLETDPSRFQLSQLFTDGIQTALMYNDEKMVVRPARVRGFWMHFATQLNEGRPVLLPTNFSVMLHAANEEVLYPSYRFN
jgi:hypothetical protein